MDTPAGVILETLSELLFVVYILPSPSIVMPYGLVPVVPRIVETPAGVILETLFEAYFAVYILPSPSIVMPYGVAPVTANIYEYANTSLAKNPNKIIIPKIGIVFLNIFPMY